MTTKQWLARIGFFALVLPFAAVIAFGIGWTIPLPVDAPADAPEVTADEDAADPVGNSCRQDNCGPGCSVSCPANKEASCTCVRREVPCQGPYGGLGPCYDYTPYCTCR